MTAILTLIYCWLEEFFFSLTDWGLGIWDSLLSVADSIANRWGIVDGGPGFNRR